MIVFVDGNAILRCFERMGSEIVVAGSRERSRRNLALWFIRYAEHQDCDVVVVWDDSPMGEVRAPVEHRGRVKVVNLPYGEEARTEIAGPANRSAVKERTFVVTEDFRLREALKGGAARAFEPEQFIRKAKVVMRGAQDAALDEPDEKFSGLSDQEVDYWMGLFGKGDQ